ncbi:LytTR family DNA-binding domain-containing protein [Fulvivirgaceae bacterium BMA10]|uniref:LytTR family DNA-binding domain-containing protein n=1 Tax=Splendidivirga corallicola TaxID=3051826 RepID=A0ABT8KX04_9BACT|nr:LytTR family DNA-binding domain-containing protein [Fulvivirgaceae bacterium BMA10]
MRKIRTLVIDDEPFARARVIKLLERYDYIVILGECKNGSEARDKINQYKPDLIFLDIQMPDFNGFEVLNELPKDHWPFVIFVTAYDQFALKAFDVHAVDYLLKPYDDDRFEKALNHAKEQILWKEGRRLNQKMFEVLEEYHKEQRDSLEVFHLKERGRNVNIKVYDVFWIEVKSNYVQLNTANGKHMVRQTMQSIEASLSSADFIRIHRSYIINKHFVSNIKYMGNNEYTFFMPDNKKIISSRSYKQTVKKFLENEDPPNQSK